MSIEIRRDEGGGIDVAVGSNVNVLIERIDRDAISIQMSSESNLTGGGDHVILVISAGGTVFFDLADEWSDDG